MKGFWVLHSGLKVLYTASLLTIWWVKNLPARSNFVTPGSFRISRPTSSSLERKAFSIDFQLPPFCNKPRTAEREGRYNPTEMKEQRNREKPNHPTTTSMRRGAEDTQKPILREGHYSTISRESATLKHHGLGLGEVIDSIILKSQLKPQFVYVESCEWWVHVSAQLFSSHMDKL